MIGLRTAALTAAWALSPPVDAIAPCDGQSTGQVERIPIRAGLDIDIEVPAKSKGLLIEEFGADLQVRSAADAEFVEIAVRPQRLGLAAVRARSKFITVRSNPAQAAALVVVRTRCAQEDDLVFFESLQRRFADQIEAGAAKSIEALPQIEHAMAATTNPLRRAWLLHTLANATLSAGQHEQSAELFANTRTAWQAAEEPARAAVALMAVGEDLSRAGKYDEAETALRAAESELKTVGLSYFELRARAQQCLILSRRGNPKDSVECETAVAKRYEAMGEMAAAGASGISIANLWMKLGDLKRARERLIAVDKYGEGLLPVTRAKLNAAFGTYYLQTGELDNAVRELQAASTRMGELGLPKEQANIDIKLAAAARRAGALDEERRLLERALGQIQVEDAPDIVASAEINLALAHIARDGGSEIAGQLLADAVKICQRIGKSDCIERIRYAEIMAKIRTGDNDGARRSMSTLLAPELPDNVILNRLLNARLALLDGNPTVALKYLDALPEEILDIDLDLERALLRAQILEVKSSPEAARAWLARTFAAAAGRARQLPTAALRASARHRLAALQSAIFDLVPIDASGRVSANDMADVAAAIDAISPKRLLSGAVIDQLRVDSSRRELSAAVAGGAAADEREVFLALSSSHGRGSAPADDEAVAGSVRDAQGLQLFPLAGAKQFQVLVRANGLTRRCLVIPRAEYDALAARFEQAMAGAAVDLSSLDSAALGWFDAIAACSDRPADRWNIVLTPSSARDLPWAWIAAAAELRNSPEPAIALQFDSHPATKATIARPAGLTILNLDLADQNALPFASVEATKVRSVFESMRITVAAPNGRELTPELFFRELATPARWVHVIGHGNDRRYGSLYAGLWLPSEKGPLLVAFPEIASSASNADLVVLSACGDGKAQQGPAASRLRVAEALLATGAGTVVATTNEASDSAAAYWAPRLYRSILEQGEVATAAVVARKSLRATPHFRHPRFWAGLEVYRD